MVNPILTLRKQHDIVMIHIGPGVLVRAGDQDLFVAWTWLMADAMLLRWLHQQHPTQVDRPKVPAGDTSYDAVRIARRIRLAREKRLKSEAEAKRREWDILSIVAEANDTPVDPEAAQKGVDDLFV